MRDDPSGPPWRTLPRRTHEAAGNDPARADGPPTSAGGGGSALGGRPGESGGSWGEEGRAAPLSYLQIVEKRERLEQLRALEAGMRIDVAIVDTVPLGVDAPSDLVRARELLG